MRWEVVDEPIVVAEYGMYVRLNRRVVSIPVEGISAIELYTGVTMKIVGIAHVFDTDVYTVEYKNWRPGESTRIDYYTIDAECFDPAELSIP